VACRLRQGRRKPGSVSSVAAVNQPGRQRHGLRAQNAARNKLYGGTVKASTNTACHTRLQVAGGRQGRNTQYVYSIALPEDKVQYNQMVVVTVCDSGGWWGSGECKGSVGTQGIQRERG